jgi:F-type H+-transporting ATPase subunit delta
MLVVLSEVARPYAEALLDLVNSQDLNAGSAVKLPLINEWVYDGGSYVGSEWQFSYPVIFSRNSKEWSDSALALKEQIDRGEALQPRDKYLTETIHDMNSVWGVFIAHPTLRKFFGSPVTAREHKKVLIKEIFGRLVNGTTLNFLLLLVDCDRIDIFESIAQYFLELSNRYRAIETAKVTSAVPLSVSQRAKIREKIKCLTNAKKVNLKSQVDPDILDGFVLEVRSKMLDTSARTQLTELSEFLVPGVRGC